MLHLALATVIAAATPLRTLVYHFSVDVRGFGSSPSMGGGVVSEGSSFGTASRSGKMTFAIVQATADGGLVVDVTESPDREARPMQTVRCAVYGKTLTVICDQNLETSVEQTELVGYIGRNFLRMDLVDDKNHWQAVTPMTNMSVVSDYTISKTDGKLLTIDWVRKERNGPNGQQEDVTGQMLYDGGLDVPKWLKITSSRRGNSSQGDMNLKAELLTDSMAPAGS